MVDYRKRVEEAASGILSPVERVLAGVNVTGSPFRMAGAGVGAIGAAARHADMVVAALAEHRPGRVREFAPEKSHQ